MTRIDSKIVKLSQNFRNFCIFNHLILNQLKLLLKRTQIFLASAVAKMIQMIIQPVVGQDQLMVVKSTILKDFVAHVVHFQLILYVVSVNVAC